MKSFLDVLLPLPLAQYFTYKIPPEFERRIEVGMRVSVPFGKSKIYTGIICKIHDQQPLHYEAKYIDQVLDDESIVTAEQLAFWQWIASYYMCAEGEVMKAALPGALLLESETIIQLNTSTTEAEVELTDDEFLITEALHAQSSLKVHEVMQLLDKKRVLPILNALVQKGVVDLTQELYEQYKPKLVRYVRLHPSYASDEALHKLLDQLSRAPKQREVILNLFSLQAKDKGPIEVATLTKVSNASSGTIKILIVKDILEEYHLQKDRIHYDTENSSGDLELSTVQQTAHAQIEQGFKKNRVCLLHGVTSSGKTEIYIKLIEKALQLKKQILYLLPEIALTTQLISRLQSYFGQEVLVYHSKYSVQERVEVYRHIKEGTKGKIVIGARSSVLLPFTNLGLIVVDESHESSYKQYDPAPRYHARDAAIVLAKQFDANIVLGSATPGVESYFNAQQDKYQLVELGERFKNILPPVIKTIHLGDKHKRKEMKGNFSNDLILAIERTLKAQKQVILFQNRRGYSPILTCNSCGHVPQCANCDVSLTYHQYNNQLRCHYCGYHMAMQTHCLVCESNQLTTKGFGTEQIEAELKELFPKATSARMDLDTTRGKHGYEKIIHAFENAEIDILVGTQMLSKGLDFRNVDLVGIMSADSLLNYPDFRAYERSFQLMLQVAGRAGRTQQQGEVLIQSFNPNHAIIKQVVRYDYAGMYRDQIKDREVFHYPPFFRLIRLTFKGRDFNRVNDASQWTADVMRQQFGEHVLGPEYPPISRIRNQYHKNVLLKIPQGQSLPKTKKVLRRVLKSYEAIGSYRSVRVIINVDPY
ncbi:primosomal protein N' [Gangjinia marincola]|uniref:Replication restart protein PriA n=1 Tax=Gangjinia marincola TaxID=578463 RepID=A0ABN1MGL1_9FLAO